MKRRIFIQMSGAGLLGATLASCNKSSGAADVRVAIIGLHGRGKQLLKDLNDTKGAKVVAFCDVDQRELDKHKADQEKAVTSVKLATFTNYRKLLESKDVDAVVIATPNHTHSLIAISAIAAGKHVYVEKPVSHNIWEGRKLVEAAAKRPNLIVQHGMQRRSEVGWQEAMEYLKKGDLGRVIVSRGINWKPRQSIGKINGERRMPKAVDANLWFGPRTPKPIIREQFHYDWHWFWEYGNGDIGNQGPHQFDIARRSLGDPAAPKNVLCLGGRWGYDDDGQTPNQQLAFYDYGNDQQMVFDNRGLPASDMDFAKKALYRGKFDVGNAIMCENGWIGERFVYDNDGKEIKKFGGTDGPAHMINWIKSIQAGSQTDANLSVEVGHHAALLAHLSNISYRVGKQLPAGEVMERIKGNKDALATWEDLQANLQANKVDIAAKLPQLGAALTFDPVKEMFTGEFATEANALVTEDYRDEFKLPEIS